jgi:hypothetical protein
MALKSESWRVGGGLGVGSLRGAFLGGLGGVLVRVCVGGLGWQASEGESWGEDADAFWKQVMGLDAGPAQTPRSVGEARELFSRHLEKQEGVLRRFLGATGKEDPRGFEAQIRLARVLTMRAEMESKPEWQLESAKILDGLDAGGTREQKAEVGFTRISQWMRRHRFPTVEQRGELLAAVREFWKAYPFDRRLAGLLVEVATRFDRDLAVKEELLSGAARLNQDPELRRRIEDDRARMELFGKALPLRFQDLNGRNFRMEEVRGRSVVVLYFSAGSPPSLEGWRKLNGILAQYPGWVRVGVSLDEDRVAMERVRRELGEGWIIAWDGRGWMSPLARRWGVNALPTAWVVDGNGKVVSLNALEDASEQFAQFAGAQAPVQSSNRAQNPARQE